MMEFLRSMFLTPEAQPGAYPWASALFGHAFVGVVLLAVTGALVWAICAVLRRVGVAPAWRPSSHALGLTLVLYAAWEGAQVALVGGGVGDAVVDWLAVACGALIAWGAWRTLIIPVGFGLLLLLAVLIDGLLARIKGDVPPR